jgi:hypothetical protein
MTDERITAYLLQELSAREAEIFEEQCFAQDEWPAAELTAAEDDLIQAYIRQELSPERHQLFEKNYMTTAARKERVLMARSFLCVVCSTEPTKVKWSERLQIWVGQISPQVSVPKFASVLLVAALGVSLTIFTWTSLRNRGPQTFAQLNLVMSSENRSAGGQQQKVTLPLAEDALRISLALPGNEPKGATYRVQLEDVKGSLDTLKTESQDDKGLSVIIPAEKLSRGQYALKLFRKNQDGTEARVEGSYFFNVE